MVVGYRRALRVGALFVWANCLILAASTALAANAAPATARETVRVNYVLDGDSLRLSDGRELRLIGMNAPEHGKNGAADEPLAREARRALIDLVGRGEIAIEYDTERQDRYRRHLVHALLSDGRSVEEIMLRQGFAFFIALAPNLARLEQYRTAEAEARRAHRGVWAQSYYAPRAAEHWKTGDTGFHFVEGKIQRVGRGSELVYLDLADNFTLAIPKEYWRDFGGDLTRLRGRHVIARGWITVHENRFRLRLTNPAMWELVD